jgi:hypothetical protein
MRRFTEAEASTTSKAIYSTRRPEMARLMTRRWISEVPSKIV